MAQFDHPNIGASLASGRCTSVDGLCCVDSLCVTFKLAAVGYFFRNITVTLVVPVDLCPL